MNSSKENHLQGRCQQEHQTSVTDAPFICRRCASVVPAGASGTAHRDHCPRCLWSLHVDLHTGDRQSTCRGLMEPIAVSVRRGGEWVIIHRCRECGGLRANRIAGDDNELALLSLAVRPLAQPPFPLDTFKLAEDLGS